MCATAFSFVIILLFAGLVSSDEVLGCNGFVKSNLTLDLSKVSVKLFTKQGSLKDQTECAPTNGYYFLPLYDYGDYIIKVSSPHGWSFEPKQVSISVDGTNDPCSQGKDINFVFNGFSLSGKVISKGSQEGPTGVSLELHDSATSTPLLTVTSENGGLFHFSCVKPGKYIIKAKHPRWQIDRNNVPVEIKSSSVQVAAGSLQVAGYDVTGSVMADNQPSYGVLFVLYSSSSAKSSDMVGCESVRNMAVPDIPGMKAVCHVMSDEEGKFKFPQVEPGSYCLVPYHNGAGARFHVLPRKFDFTVSHSSLVLPPVFQVQGYTVSGRVLWSKGGLPIENVKVHLAGDHVASTNAQGIYTLDGIKAASYSLEFHYDTVVFDSVDMKVSGPQLTEVYPVKFKVSGKLLAPYDNRKVIARDISSESTVEASVDSSGQYYFFLRPGKYSITVSSPESQDSSVKFYPQERLIEVKSSVMEGIDFSQLKCTISGSLECFSDCNVMVVKLKPKHSGQTIEMQVKAGQFYVENIMPGDYNLFLGDNGGLCWERESQLITVAYPETKGYTFRQTGFILPIVSSHSTKVEYRSLDGKVTGSVEVGVGNSQVCVASKGPYTVEAKGCHKFKDPSKRWSFGQPPVSLLAISHEHKFSLVTSEMVDDLKLVAFSSADTPSEVLKPMEVDSKSVDGSGRKKLIYRLYLSEGETVHLQPSSSSLLFSPLSSDIIGHNDCLDNTEHPTFTAHLGIVLKGRVTSSNDTGLSGATVSVLDSEGKLITTLETSSSGFYQSQPLPSSTHYNVTAVKEGYVLTGPSKAGDFSAHKLAEIIVLVTDSDLQPLQGVLLSLSGEHMYRRNAQTDAKGSLSFISLSPGLFFLRPMMKEYKFTPNSKTIEITEGTTHKIHLKGIRVAYSGFGTVLSLNGDGEPGVIVEAVAEGDCTPLQEEATSGPSGEFRIRGLQSGCQYQVRVKEGPEINQHVFKSSPQSISITINGKDVQGLEVLAFRWVSRTDVIAHVSVMQGEQLKTLRVKVAREDSPERVVSSVKLSDYRPSQGYSLRHVVVSLPPVPADGSTYLVSLECSQARAEHIRAVRIRASGGAVVARMRWAPPDPIPEPDSAHCSAFALPLVLAALLAYRYRAALRNLRPSSDDPSPSFLDLKRKTKLKKLL